MQVLSLDALAHSDRGFFRGVSTVSFIPAEAPGHLTLGPLRLFSIDTVDPGGVFETHRHDDVEVITLVLEGALDHEDSLGVSERTEAGGVQVMRAGRGLQHTERNPSDEDDMVGIQIWLEPRTRDAEPSVARQAFELGSSWTLMVAAEGAPLLVDQDIRLAQVRVPPSGSVSWVVAEDRAAYFAVADGAMQIDGLDVATLERAIAREPGEVTLRSEGGAHVVVLDLALPRSEP